jgi:hypothetical protein
VIHGSLRIPFSSTGSGVSVASGLAARALAIGNERPAAKTKQRLAKRKFAQREEDFVAVFIEVIRSEIRAAKMQPLRLREASSAANQIRNAPVYRLQFY